MHHLPGLEIGDKRTRCRGVRRISDGGTQMPDVHVDAVTEDENLHEGNADDHAPGQAVSPQLTDFLSGDRGDPSEKGYEGIHLAAVPSVAATNTSSRFARTSLTSAPTDALLSAARTKPAASPTDLSTKACSLNPSCA